MSVRFFSHSHQKHTKQQAFSLVELMLCVLLGTCLLMLMVRHYLMIKQRSVDTTQALSQVYDQQLITELIRTSIRQAGFTPCVPLRWLNTGDDAKRRLEDLVLNVGAKKALQIARMSEDFTIISEMLSTQQFMVEAGGDLRENMRVLVADCMHAEVQTIKSITRHDALWRVKLIQPLHYLYTSPIYIGEWLQESFFVDKNNQGQNALYYQLQHPEELSADIKGMVVKLENHNFKRLVSIDFLVSDNKTWHLETAVRV